MNKSINQVSPRGAFASENASKTELCKQTWVIVVEKLTKGHGVKYTGSEYTEYIV